MPSIIQKAPTHRHYAEIFQIAIPLGLANLLLAGNSTVDLLMIGQLGTSEIAGATLSIQLYLLLVVFGGGVLMAFTPLFSIARTQKATNTAGATFVGALLLAIIISALAAVVMWLSPTILDAFGVERKLTELAQSYVRKSGSFLHPSLPGLGHSVGDGQRPGQIHLGYSLFTGRILHERAPQLALHPGGMEPSRRGIRHADIQLRRYSLHPPRRIPRNR
ncbi:MATE family efflux transporter [Acidocella aminolytica]|uniref:MATE family efflux transporter n=1 Tax=Acidocella aminolytica TaxID=33998 RepID=UPI0009329769|nr:MATE family efflux transporter [Acidocella aminolytica]